MRPPDRTGAGAGPPARQTVQAGAEQEMRRMTRRSFAVGGAAALLGLGSWYWLGTRSLDGGIPWPLRQVLDWNGRLAQGYFRTSRLAPTFAPDHARVPRVNGIIGMERPVDVARWQLSVAGAGRAARAFPLEAIQALPRVDLVTELKCIEGWSEVVHWTGARFGDFL